METNIYDIEKYFEGTMTPEELAGFENRRQNDKAFAREVMLYAQARDVIRGSARLRLKHHLDQLGKGETGMATVESFVRYRIMRRQWMAIAATLLFLVGAFFAIRPVLFPSDGFSTLFSKYYSTPEPAVLASRSAETVNDTENDAVLFYSKRQYEEAAASFRALLENPTYSRRSAAGFFLGICYLNTNKPDSAIQSLGTVSAGSSFGDDAQWYQGLAYLMKEDKTKAGEIFNNIRNTGDHPYKKEAAKISRVLSRVK